MADVVLGLVTGNGATCAQAKLRAIDVAHHFRLGAYGDEHPDPLFDSRRSYVDQIEVYKRHQGKPTERRERRDNGRRHRRGVGDRACHRPSLR